MGVRAGFQMFLVGAALVYGLLFANLISPDRDLLRILGRGALDAGMRVRSLYSPTRPRT